MGRLRFGQRVWVGVAVSLSVFLSACGGHKPPGASPFPVKVTLSPSSSASMQLGTTLLLAATASNGSNSSLRATFTYTSSNAGILDIAPNGFACAGTWNAPSYSICTPAGTGMVEVTASALDATSPPTLIFVHAPIDSIQISVVPPVNSPPPACPAQQALPAACNLKFNENASNYCLSQNQLQTLQATAYSQGVDITASVGPFSWSDTNGTVVSVTPIVVSPINIATDQVSVVPTTPGQTQIIASASGVFSQPYNFETCPVQCIALQLGVNGSQSSNQTSFSVTKGTTETISATAVDVQGCIVTKAPLTWVSSSPAALAAGSAATGCAAGAPCSVSTAQAGSATITASCSPPTCNIGFPLNPAGFPPGSIYIPQPVYPVTAISGLVSGSTTATNVLATSQDCYSNDLCAVGLYNVATSKNLSGGPNELPTPPNSLIFDPAGDKVYMGSEFGALAINPANLGTTNNPFTSLPAFGTILGQVTGQVVAVSHSGAAAVFSDTVSVPNQVYVVNSSNSSTSAIPLNINSAIAAAFSPDGLKTFILGDAGNSLFVYSNLQFLQPPISLPAPATSIVFSSSGSFALLAGGAAPSTLAIYNTCDNSPVTLTVPPPGLPGPPLFLKMVPSGNIPLGGLFGNVIIPDLEPTGLDFFFGLDNTGIDIIATNSSQGPLTTLCPQQVALAHTTLNAPFPPVHINIGHGTFHPINFFLSPDSTRAYIVTTDFGVLVYNFNTNSVSGIKLVNNSTPVTADITADGSLIYVAGSDGLLHQLNTAAAIDEAPPVPFLPLPNSSSSFCYTGNNCSLDIVAVKP
jgi:hypothetical protein